MLHCPYVCYTKSFLSVLAHLVQKRMSVYRMNRNLGVGFTKTQHDKYCKLVMPEITVIISPVILHFAHKTSHKSHVKYSLAKQIETLLFRLLIKCMSWLIRITSMNTLANLILNMYNLDRVSKLLSCLNTLSFICFNSHFLIMVHTYLAIVISLERLCKNGVNIMFFSEQVLYYHIWSRLCK